MKSFLLCALLLASIPPLSGQQPGIDQASELLIVPAGDKFLSWHGHPGRTYFIEASTGNDALAEWHWMPLIESGSGVEIWHEVGSTAARGFFRLQYTDLAIPAGKTLETADFDNDGVSNIDEINPPSPLLPTHPLNPDTDGDSIDDGWERSFSAQMLALGAPPEHWGANWAMFQIGNVNPTATIQDGGMTIQEIYQTSGPEDFQMLLHDLFIQGRRAEFTFFVTHNSRDPDDEEAPTTRDGGGQFWDGSSYGSGSIECWSRTPTTGVNPLAVQLDPFAVTPDTTLAWFNNESDNSTWTDHTYWDDPSLRLFPIEDIDQSSVTFQLTDGGNSKYYQFQETWDDGSASITETRWSGQTQKSKFRLYRPRPTKDPVDQVFVKVTTEYALLSYQETTAGQDPPNAPMHVSRSLAAPTVTVEVITVTIPAFGHTSEWIETTPAAVAQKELVVNLAPVLLRNIRNHSNSGDDVAIRNWDSSQIVEENNVAWIEAHKSATDAAPRMPQLVFDVTGLPGNVSLEASFLVEYERPYAGKQTDDTVRIPTNGSFRSLTNGRWEIWSEYAEMPFFGGDAILTYRINGGSERNIKFCIGGRNPDDVRCKEYTQGRPGAPWYAYAIEKHESQAYNPGYYNQFWERNGNSSPINNGVNYPFTRGDVLVVRSPGETGVGGTGLAQVTGVGGNKAVSAPREVFWNWQRNVDSFLGIQAIKIQTAETFMNDTSPRSGPGSIPNGQRPQTSFHTGGNVPVPSRGQGLVTFGDNPGEKRPEDAVAIKAYNGASAHWCSWRGPAVHEWQFNYGQNNYVEEVGNEVEEEQP